MDAEEGLTGADGITDLNEGFNPDRMVDDVGLGFATAAELDHGETDDF